MVYLTSKYTSVLNAPSLKPLKLCVLYAIGDLTLLFCFCSPYPFLSSTVFILLPPTHLCFELSYMHTFFFFSSFFSSSSSFFFLLSSPPPFKSPPSNPILFCLSLLAVLSVICTFSLTFQLFLLQHLLYFITTSFPFYFHHVISYLSFFFFLLCLFSETARAPAGHQAAVKAARTVT